MSSTHHPAFISAPDKRRVGLAALIGTVLLASPVVPALAQNATPAPAHQTRAERRAETVDQRISALHAELKITPNEEADWRAVAQTMRDNGAAMQKLAAEKSSQQNMTAMDDLLTYQQFAQTRLDGLKNLVATFGTLYNAMPEQQKKLADQVFLNNRRQEASRPG